MHYVEYGLKWVKNDIFRETGYLSQFAGNYDLQVPFQLDKVSPVTAACIGN